MSRITSTLSAEAARALSVIKHSDAFHRIEYANADRAAVAAWDAYLSTPNRFSPECNVQLGKFYRAAARRAELLTEAYNAAYQIEADAAYLEAHALVRRANWAACAQCGEPCVIGVYGDLECSARVSHVCD